MTSGSWGARFTEILFGNQFVGYHPSQAVPFFFIIVCGTLAIEHNVLRSFERTKTHELENEKPNYHGVGQVSYIHLRLRESRHPERYLYHNEENKHSAA